MEKLFNYYTYYGTFSAGKKNKTKQLLVPETKKVLED